MLLLFGRKEAKFSVTGLRIAAVPGCCKLSFYGLLKVNGPVGVHPHLLLLQRGGNSVACQPVNFTPLLRRWQHWVRRVSLLGTIWTIMALMTQVGLRDLKLRHNWGHSERWIHHLAFADGSLLFLRRKQSETAINLICLELISKFSRRNSRWLGLLTGYFLALRVAHREFRDVCLFHLKAELCLKLVVRIAI